MNTNLLKIMVIALATLFLSAQAFACSMAPKDKDIGETNQENSSMYGNSGSSESSSSDMDINKDQGNYGNNEQMNQNETNKPELSEE